MTPAEIAIDGLAAQEMESLAACVSRGQPPETYADIVEKLRGHATKLPDDRKFFWSEQCRAVGVELFPQPKQKVKDKPKSDNS